MSSAGAGMAPHISSRFVTLASMMGALHPLSAATSLYFFGIAQDQLSATITGSAIVLGSLRISSWEANQNGFTHHGSDAAAVIFPGPADANTALRITVTDIASKVLIDLRAREDGRSGYQTGILQGSDIDSSLTAGNWYAVIRRFQESQPINDNAAGTTYAVPTSSSDTPPSAFAYVDVTSRVSTGQAVVLDGRIVNGVVELRINDESTPTVRHDTNVTYTPASDTAGFGTSATGSFLTFNSVGFTSAVDGARVLAASLYTLTGQTTAREDMIVLAAAGNIYIVEDGINIIQVASGAMPAHDPVSMVSIRGKVYMVGGGQARVFDPVSLLVANWVPDAGNLPGGIVPGGTTPTPGVTAARGVATHGTRAVLYDVVGDENNAYFSATDDENNWDTGDTGQGKPFTLAGVRPLKIGHPIKAWQESTNSVSIVGCNGSIQSMIGDPALGNYDTAVLEEKVGISGQKALLRLQESLVLGHGPNGMMLMPPQGTASNISRGILTAPLHLDDADLATTDVIIARDPQRFWVHIFLTGASFGKHFIFDERVGALTGNPLSVGGSGISGNGGYYPQSYPATMQPRCTDVWKNTLLIACDDGFIRTIDDSALDDDGEVFYSGLTLGPMDTPGIGNDVEVSYIRALTTQDSGTIGVRVWGAISAERVFDTLRRKLLLNKTVEPFRQEPLVQKSRSRNLALELFQESGTLTYRLEEVDAVLTEYISPTSR